MLGKEQKVPLPLSWDRPQGGGEEARARESSSRVVGSGQRGIYKELRWHKDRVTSGARGNQEDTTQEPSPRLAREGGLAGFPRAQGEEHSRQRT